MKITELLDLKGIELNVSVSSKDEAINKLIDLMCATGKIRQGCIQRRYFSP